MNSVPKTDASAPATIDFHFIGPLSPLNQLRRGLSLRPSGSGDRFVEVVRFVEQLRCLRAAGGCQQTRSIRQIDHGS